MSGTRPKPVGELFVSKQREHHVPRHQSSKADVLPAAIDSSNNQAPRRQISNPVQRSASHAKDQYSKARPINTSRPPYGQAAVQSPTSPLPQPESANIRFQTRYMEMMLNLDAIPRSHNVLAAFFSWILLAGFVVFPGTFTSTRDLSGEPDVSRNETALTIYEQARNVPLLIIASVCCGIGVLGITWMCVLQRKNHVWLLNRLYLPGVMNGLAGLISTLVSVYTNQRGFWSVPAKATVIIEGCVMAVCGLLFILYNNLLLARVKHQHEREVRKMQGEEQLLEKGEKKPEPGRVV